MRSSAALIRDSKASPSSGKTVQPTEALAVGVPASE
jgi:hypothetical protein